MVASCASTRLCNQMISTNAPPTISSVLHAQRDTMQFRRASVASHSRPPQHPQFPRSKDPHIVLVRSLWWSLIWKADRMIVRHSDFGCRWWAARLSACCSVRVCSAQFPGKSLIVVDSRKDGKLSAPAEDSVALLLFWTRSRRLWHQGRCCASVRWRGAWGCRRQQYRAEQDANRRL